eukprot:m.1384 g.1384  ORF g.1384 m.1384 type:complete len:118 (+) comp824_c0_seq1:292-645(+)
MDDARAKYAQQDATRSSIKATKVAYALCGPLPESFVLVNDGGKTNQYGQQKKTTHRSIIPIHARQLRLLQFLDILSTSCTISTGDILDSSSLPLQHLSLNAVMAAMTMMDARMSLHA